jgi:hypothetical protein
MAIPSEREPASTSSLEADHLVQKSRGLVHRFLEYADPSLLPHDDTARQHDIPIDKWDLMYSSPPPPQSSAKHAIVPSIVVRSHPSEGKNLFSVQSVVSGINARQFWSLMANGSNRHLWDSTVELSEVQYWVADRIRSSSSLGDRQGGEPERIARQLSARVELLRFGSM